jgi:hypothetical protein
MHARVHYEKHNSFVTSKKGSLSKRKCWGNEVLDTYTLVTPQHNAAQSHNMKTANMYIFEYVARF